MRIGLHFAVHKKTILSLGGRPHITSSRRGGGGVLGLMTIDDEGEGGGFIDVMTSSVYLLKPMAQQSSQ